MILTEELMKTLDNAEVIVKSIDTRYVVEYQGCQQLTVDVYVDGKYNFEESICYGTGDEVLKEHLTVFRVILEVANE